MRVALLRARACRLQGARYASHEAPQYNEPTGYFLGEKVRVLSTRLLQVNSYNIHHALAAPARPETSEGELGERMADRDVWYHGICNCNAVL